MIGVKRLLRFFFKRKLDANMLREWGAKIGNDVELYNVECSPKDATCLEIGDHVTLTGVHILTHDASTKRFLGSDCNRVGRVVIGSRVFVGVKTVILPNVTIGSNVIVGAGSVVTKSVPDNCVVVGNPAQVVCSIEDFILRHQSKMTDKTVVYWDIYRDRMSKEELIEFNNEINGKIVYLCDSRKV